MSEQEETLVEVPYYSDENRSAAQQSFWCQDDCDCWACRRQGREDLNFPVGPFGRPS